MDYTRVADLEMLAEGMKKARTVKERERYEKIAHRIMQVSIPIQSLRNDLVQAMSKGDTLAVKKISMHINAIRQEETNGQSWGNVRGEGIDKGV